MPATTFRSPSLLAAIAVVTFGTGCEPDPVAADLDSWYYGLSAVLVENATLAHDIQEYAAKISTARKSGKVSAEKTAKGIATSIVPAARSVAEHGTEVRPNTPEYQTLHDDLVKVWTARADAYEGILTAFEAADNDAVQAGMEQVRDLRISESMWFPTANAVIEPKGYRFEEFPQTVPVPPAQ